MGAPALLLARPDRLALSVFDADVTPPIGGPLFNGVPARSITDPLQARGFVLTGAGRPVVFCAIDWCEIRNESFEAWRRGLAAAAATSPERVMLSTVHQHDAPYTDRLANRLLIAHNAKGVFCDTAFEDACIQRVAEAIRQAMAAPVPVDSVGMGRGRVEGVASNRRFADASGRVQFSRTSATRNPAIRAMPEGLIDPWARTISFWSGNRPVAAVNCYATHPMSYYGQGDVTGDFPVIARRRRQQDDPAVHQIYLSGCSGDTMAGRYNDGAPENRQVLAGRLYDGLAAAWRDTRREPIRRVSYRVAKLRLQARRTPGFAIPEMQAALRDPALTFRAHTDAALGLAWRARLDRGHAIDVPCLDLGAARIVLLPAESFVQYQIWAQQVLPSSFVLASAFTESAPGYIPTAEAAREGYDDRYSWIAFPECEAAMRQALTRALTGQT